MRLMISLWLCSVLLNAADFEIRGGNYANWFPAGEPVVFKANRSLPETETLTVYIYDSAGRKIAEESVSADEISRDGWRWTAPHPGFFEAEFLRNGKPVAESYRLRLRKWDETDKTKIIPVADQEFPVTRHAFAVVPGRTPEPKQISPHFGASPHFGFYQDAIPLMRLLGVHSIRAHGMAWDRIEPKKGVFRWNEVDEFMKLAEKNGFSGEQIVFNVMGIPQWASSRPEATAINVCVREYSTVLPKDLRDWQNFLRLSVKRYPSVRRYELWNEPHLPGFSCFWADTPENFLKLLKSGYEAVKQEKPDAVVWLGGIGMRYLSFYRKLLELGGGKYFDVLPLHGSWMDPVPFHRIEKLFGVPEKPVVSSEWHAMLLSPDMPEYPSERLLARNMLLDFLNQIRAGIEEVDFFCILNLPDREKETLAFHKKHKRRTHVSGLFRQRPYIQPRYPAVAWHNFTRLIRGRIHVLDGYYFAENGQYAQLLKTDGGELLIFWNGKKTAEKIAPRLFRAVSPSSELRNAEGTVLSIGSGFMLEPETYYILRNPDGSAVAQWKNKDNVLISHAAGQSLNEDFKGTYRKGKLFDDSGALIESDSIPWLPLDRFVPMEENMAGVPVSGRFAAAVSPDGVELLAEIRDPVHHAPESSLESWKFDSLQFAFDTRNRGMKEDRIEILAVAGTDGKVDLWKSKAAGIGGDLPLRYTMEGERIRFAAARMSRTGDRSFYRIRIGASELYPLNLVGAPVLRFAILANNNDGSGRTGYAEWGGGIGGGKDPVYYGTLTLSGGRKTIFTQRDLSRKGWNRDYELKFRADSVEVIGSSPLCSGVSTPTFPVTPGIRFRVSFEIRGNAKFEMMVGGKGMKRLDLLKPILLTGQWKTVECEFIAPIGAKNASISAFAWKQPGCKFEIRKFKVERL